MKEIFRIEFVKNAVKLLTMSHQVFNKAYVTKIQNKTLDQCANLPFNLRCAYVNTQDSPTMQCRKETQALPQA